MHELLKRLIEERAQVWEGLKPIYDAADSEKRDLTAEELQEDERRNTKLDELDTRIADLQERVERERVADDRRAAVEKLVRPDEDRAPADSSLEARLIDWARGKGPKAIEVSTTDLRAKRTESGLWEVRDLSVASDGAVVPESFRSQLYEHMIENSGIRRTRATVLTTDSGDALILPKTTAHPAEGTIVAEGAGIGETEPTFGQGTLQAFKYAELVQVSSELLQDTGVDLLGYLARSFGRAIGNGAGADFVVGTGSSQPNGVVTAGSPMVTGGTGVSGAPTADDLIDLVYTVTEPYALNGEFLLRRATVGSIRKLKDNDGQYLWQAGIAGNAPNTILGFPYVTDPNVPATAVDATSVAFGDFSAYYIRDVGAVRFERSDDFAFANDLVTFRAILRTDGDLLDTTGAIGCFVGGTA